MTASGRHPTPTKLRVLTGNPGKRPLPENEPEPKARREPPPPHLTEEGKKEWRRMMKRLYPLGLFTEIDHAALAAYCSAWSRYVEAEEALKKYGAVLPTPNGLLMQSPYLSIANRAMDQMLRFLAEFGMSPSSRTRVKASPPGSEEQAGNKWAGLL